MLKAIDIEKSYDNLKVLNKLSIEVQSGELVSIVGSSGAGKTTFLQILGTLEKPDKGHYTIDGVAPFSLSNKKLAKFRNENIGFIFQFHQLLPEFTALENIILPSLIKGTPKQDAEKRAKEVLNFLNLKHRNSHKPSQLSGGEQQRVAVARALINNPKIIFADEPSGNLDKKNANELHQLFFDLRKEFGQTFIIVTHNPNLAEISDRVLTMEKGQII